MWRRYVLDLAKRLKYKALGTLLFEKHGVSLSSIEVVRSWMRQENIRNCGNNDVNIIGKESVFLEEEQHLAW